MVRWSKCLLGVLAIGTLLSEILADPATCGASEPEPNTRLAAQWWPPQRNVWTPIGWKDHLFRFDVIFNGTVVAQPHVPLVKKKHTQPWEGQGVILSMTPIKVGKEPDPPRKEPYLLAGLLPEWGEGRQGWSDHPAPVLWTEWPVGKFGMIIRQEIFAHIPGGGEVQTGIEPLYAWIRFYPSYIDKMAARDRINLWINLRGEHIGREMQHEKNLLVFPDKVACPRPLTAQMFQADEKSGCRILQEDGKVRLLAMTKGKDVFAFTERDPDSRDYFLCMTLSVHEGSYIDLLLPMLPSTKEEIDAEWAVGRDEALRQADAFWSVKPPTAARIDTPEPRINQAIDWSLKLGQILTERNPEKGEYSFISGSWQYDALWPTPTSMVAHMMYDPLGYHEIVEKHIELFRLNQGTIKPPGEHYELHPGYFSSPKSLTSIDWITDHGAILHMVSRHALITGNAEFIQRWLEPVVMGCDFLKELRANRKHDGIPGILPPAVPNDIEKASQTLWNISWNYKGLKTAVRLLQRLGHPRAEEFAREAEETKSMFVKTLREYTLKMPTWTDRGGREHHIVPTALQPGGGGYLGALYLDTGPMVLVWAELLEANDPLMKSTVAWFREGPNWALFDPRGDFNQRPVLIHEISSDEPCYSWNVYHNWQLGDRQRYLEGMYSLLAGAMSDQTFISCETRHGIYGNVFVAPVLIDLIRLAVVDDQLSTDDLHLLRLVPRAWLRTDYTTRFEKIATEFGPVTLRFGLSDEGKTLDVAFEASFRHVPRKILLHVPPVAGLSQVRINGKTQTARPGDKLTIAPADAK